MCNGVTSYGRPCKSRVHAEYCKYHMDQKPIPFYTDCRPSNWPFTFEIQSRVQKYSSQPSEIVLLIISEWSKELCVSIESLHHTDWQTNKYLNRRFAICSTELIKLNKEVCYVDPSIQLVARSLVTRLESVPELVAYTEDFKRQCLASHRDAARKRVYSFYFTRCEDLCDEVIEKILGYL